jgi:RHS repeat-associated protein
MPAAVTAPTASGAEAECPENRVKALDVLTWPRVGVRSPESPDRRWENRPRYDGKAVGTVLARYYDPATGQFLSVDPDVATTLSPYGYLAGNPLNAGDPSGLCGWNPLDWLSCIDPDTIQSQYELAHPTPGQELQNLGNLAVLLNLEDGGGEAIEGCELARPESINLADPELGAFSRTTNSFGQAAPEGEGYTYGDFHAANNPGEMAGARAVRTIDTSSGDTIGWQYETYDDAGNIRIIRPQWGDVPGTHFYYDAIGNFTGAG